MCFDFTPTPKFSAQQTLSLQCVRKHKKYPTSVTTLYVNKALPYIAESKLLVYTDWTNKLKAFSVYRPGGVYACIA